MDDDDLSNGTEQTTLPSKGLPDFLHVVLPDNNLEILCTPTIGV